MSPSVLSRYILTFLTYFAIIATATNSMLPFSSHFFQVSQAVSVGRFKSENEERALSYLMNVCVMRAPRTGIL